MAPLELVVAAPLLQELGPAHHLSHGTLSIYSHCNCSLYLGDARGWTGGARHGATGTGNGSLTAPGTRARTPYGPQHILMILSL
jgi:hypothetical protein